jgi:hypothetical protein
MRVVIRHRETADGYGEATRKFLESAIDPSFAVGWTFAEQKGAADTARAVISAGHGNVDQVCTGHRHECCRQV